MLEDLRSIRAKIQLIDHLTEELDKVLQEEKPQELDQKKLLEKAEHNFELKKKHYELLHVRINKLERAKLRIRLEQEPLDQVIEHLEKNLEQLKVAIQENMSIQRQRMEYKEDLQDEISDHIKQLEQTQHSQETDRRPHRGSLDLSPNPEDRLELKARAKTVPQSPRRSINEDKEKNILVINDASEEYEYENDEESSEYGEELSFHPEDQAVDPIDYRLVSLYSSIPTIIFFLLFYSGLLI